MNSSTRATDTITRCGVTRTARPAEQTVLLASCAITSAFVWTLSTIKGGAWRASGEAVWTAWRGVRATIARQTMLTGAWCSGKARLGLFFEGGRT